MRHLISWLSITCATLGVARTTLAAVVAGDNAVGPLTVMLYPGDVDSGFVIDEDVSYDPNAGAWHKELANFGAPALSGIEFLVDESLTNAGTQAWTDWHEQVLSTTDGGGGMIIPGFLFTAGSVEVFRNGAMLNEGPDYSLMHDFQQGGNWSTVWLVFHAGSQIQPGDTLRITKHIFEVFGDANIWATGEIALVSQHPTVPEPTSLGLALAGATAALGCAFGRRFQPRRDRASRIARAQ